MNAPMLDRLCLIRPAQYLFLKKMANFKCYFARNKSIQSSETVWMKTHPLAALQIAPIQQALV